MARETYKDFGKEEGPKVLGPFGGNYDVTGFAVDVRQPVVALYESHQISCVTALARAAARMRRRGEPAANFVVIPDGLHAETITRDELTSCLEVSAGYTYDHKGTVYVFDQPDKPLTVAMADSGISFGYVNPTMRQLTDAGIPMLRPLRYFSYDDKWPAKQRMQYFGIKTPDAQVIGVQDFAKLEGLGLPERFVVKPRRGMVGRNVEVFDEGLDEERLTVAVEAIYANGSDDVLVEEFIDSAQIKLGSIEGPASFNLRVVVYNGYCGAYARVYPKHGTGNVYRGAQRMTLPRLKDALRRRHGFDPAQLQDDIENMAYEIGGAFPNCLIGADIMVMPDASLQACMQSLRRKRAP